MWEKLAFWERGRKMAGLFRLTLLAFIGGGLLAVAAPEVALGLGAALTLGAAGMGVKRLIQWGRSRRARPVVAPLSRDELRVARSKLVKTSPQELHERSVHFGSGGDRSVARLQRGGGRGGDFAGLPSRGRA